MRSHTSPNDASTPLICPNSSCRLCNRNSGLRRWWPPSSMKISAWGIKRSRWGLNMANTQNYPAIHLIFSIFTITLISTYSKDCQTTTIWGSEMNKILVGIFQNMRKQMTDYVDECCHKHVKAEKFPTECTVTHIFLS